MARKAVRIKDKLPQFSEQVKRRAERAMTKILITGKAHAAAMTPSETSNLVNSAYYRVWVTGYQVKGAVGYTANYAAALHALDTQKLKGLPRPSGKGVFWGPGGETHFLVKGFEESRDMLRSIVREEMKP